MRNASNRTKAAAVLVGLGAISLHVWRHWGDPDHPTAAF